jgi:hypothetical protein
MSEDLFIFLWPFGFCVLAAVMFFGRKAWLKAKDVNLITDTTILRFPVAVFQGGEDLL